jgi:hypothetical protein
MLVISGTPDNQHDQAANANPNPPWLQRSRVAGRIPRSGPAEKPSPHFPLGSFQHFFALRWPRLMAD